MATRPVGASLVGARWGGAGRRRSPTTLNRQGHTLDRLAGLDLVPTPALSSRAKPRDLKRSCTTIANPQATHLLPRLAGLDPAPMVGRGRAGDPLRLRTGWMYGRSSPSHPPPSLHGRPQETPLQRRPRRGAFPATAWLDVTGVPPATPHRGYRPASECGETIGVWQIGGSRSSSPTPIGDPAHAEPVEAPSPVFPDPDRGPIRLLPSVRTLGCGRPTCRGVPCGRPMGRGRAPPHTNHPQPTGAHPRQSCRTWSGTHGGARARGALQYTPRFYLPQHISTWGLGAKGAAASEGVTVTYSYAHPRGRNFTPPAGLTDDTTKGHLDWTKQIAMDQSQSQSRSEKASFRWKFSMLSLTLRIRHRSLPPFFTPRSPLPII